METPTHTHFSYTLLEASNCCCSLDGNKALAVFFSKRSLSQC